VPPLALLVEFVRQLLQAGTDTAAAVSWSQVSWRCFRVRLYLLPQLPPLPAPACADLAAAVTLAGAGAGILRATAGAGSLDPRHSYSVRLRRGGERCQPQGRRHSQSLKKLLQEAAVAPWLRERLPLVFCGDRLAAVADLWVCADFAVPPASGWALQWQTPFRLPPPG
jgi:tRNA(Ile)-lysidine synthase